MKNIKPAKPASSHYINKEEFTDEMDIHAAECRAARDKGKPEPKCPESIGKKFLLIATNVANKGNFYNYSYKDEMISDALENMVRYKHNYRKDRGAAFSYFTQYAIYAFLARIKLEKKEQTKRVKLMQKLAVHEMAPHVLNDADLDMEFKNEYADWITQFADDHAPDE